MEVNAPPPVVEAPPPGETPASPKQEQVSPQFEALAKREREIVRRMNEAKKLESTIAEREAKAKELETKYSKKMSPIEALQAHGYSYEEATQFILNDSKPTPELEVKSVKDELRQMREDYEREQKAQREAQAKELEQSRAQAVATYKADLADYITENAEKFDLVAQDGEDAVNLVYETITEDWQKKLEKYEASGRVGRPPKIMSTEEAVGLVESFYETKMDDFYSKSKKLQNKYTKATPPEPPPADPKAPAAQPKTLSNGLVSPSAPQFVSAATEADRMARALKALG